MAPIKRATPPPQQGANFGDLGFYGGSLGLPEGCYALEFTSEMFQPTKKGGEAVGQPFLSIMLNATPITPEGERREGDLEQHPLSLGQKAKDGWVPTADSKGIVPIPGTSVTLANSTNWGYFLKSLYDCGLPQGTFTNSLEALDGIWVRTQNIPEPEERKDFRKTAATGEAANAPVERRNNKICVVTEILEGGKPWEGTGGIPEGEAAPAPTKAPAVVGPKARTPLKAVAPAPVAEESTEEDVETAAQTGMASVLEKAENANGCPRLKLRTGTFNAVKADQGDEMAAAVIASYFDAGDPALNKVLEPLGYVCKGGQVKVK